MEDIDSSPLAPISPNLGKRVAPHYLEHGVDENTRPLNLKGTQFIMPTPPDTEGSSNASSDDKSKDERAVSPAPSSISALSSIVASAPMQVSSKRPHDAAQLPPFKKRKLSPSEVLEKEREKQFKAREKEEKLKQKAEEKARKDEEKAERDEEKRKKAEEKEIKRRDKELEEERKAQEKLKKERSQMRLGAFFQKPSTPAKSPVTHGDSSTGFTRRKSLSLEPFDAVAVQLRCSASPMANTLLARESVTAPVAPLTKLPISDYKKHFLPFVPPSHSSVATEYVITNPDDLAYWQGMFDAELREPAFHEKKDLGIIQPSAEFDHLFKPQVSRGTSIPNIRALVDRIQGTSQQPIDLTTETTAQDPMQALQAVSRRLLQFHQDVRPPWFGSYTKITSPSKAKKLCRNPFTRVRIDTDYEYDSEAEWEEPEEGEDIDLDEDDEAESLGDADEMDEFLDDEEDMIKNKHKMITGDLVPTSSGLCWEDQSGRILAPSGGENEAQEMRGMRLGFLLPGFTGETIDPFCASYWTNHMDPPGAPVVEMATKSSQNLTTPSRPSRPFLQDRVNPAGPIQQQLMGAADGTKGPITSTSSSTSAKRVPRTQPKFVGAEVMEEFKMAVIGSRLGKLDLLKELKKWLVAPVYF
nr:chromatin assembly factor 1 subunit rlf2 [Quercus suber]